MQDNSSIKNWLMTLIIAPLIVAVFNHLIDHGFLDSYFKTATAHENEMKIKSDSAKIIPISKSPTINDIEIVKFKGNVGRLNAIFNLTFNFTDKKIYGVYYYPARPGINYKLTGLIFGDHIELTEYTENKITAQCKLQSVDKNCYSGTMYNISDDDHRQLDINFCKVSTE